MMATLTRTLCLVLTVAGAVILVPARGENPEAEKALSDGLGAEWNQKYDEAVAAFSRAIALEPKYILAYANRASAYEMQGKLDLALADANRAIELAPKYGGAYLIRGGIYIDRHEPAKALADLTRSIERHPVFIAFDWRADVYFNLGRYDLAIKDYTQAIAPNNVPDPPDMDILDSSTAAIMLGKEQPYYFRALAHQRLGQLTEAQADLSEAIKSDPSLGAQLAKNQPAATATMDQAVHTYADALDDEPSDDGAYFTHARPGFSEHNFQAALTNLNSVIQQNPADAQAQLDRGYAEFKLNDYEKSVSDTSHSLNFKPSNASAYNNRALAYLTTGEFDRAIDDYNMVIRLILIVNTTADRHRQALAYCGLGKAFGLKGDDVNAKVAFNLAVETAPDLAIVYRFRADYELAAGNETAALADYSHASQLNPQSAEALSGRAWVLATSTTAALHDPTTAVTDASKACNLTAWNDADLLGVLAAACATAGDFTSAQKWEAEAVSILNHEPDQAANAEAKRRLLLYQANKPYAAPP